MLPMGRKFMHRERGKRGTTRLCSTSRVYEWSSASVRMSWGSVVDWGCLQAILRRKGWHVSMVGCLLCLGWGCMQIQASCSGWS